MSYTNVDARRTYQREYYQKVRKHRKNKKKIDWILKLGGKCSRCGYNKCIRALEFHHRDPSEKDFAIFDTWRSDEIISKEIEKCDILCANCHAEEHCECIQCSYSLVVRT